MSSKSRLFPSEPATIVLVANAQHRGLCTTLMGIVHNYTGLLVVRAFLGLAEGGLFPGVTY